MRVDSEPAASTASLGASLTVQGLGVRYGARTVLESVDLSASAGSITAIIGPSGCGKSSFLSCLNRLTDYADACTVTGRVLIGGVDVADRSLDVLALRRRVGMIFQKPNPFPLSIRKNIAFPLKQHGMPEREIDAAVRAALEAVGLWTEVKDRLGSPALALSGGQQQRLCIARAVALEPHMLLLDEPCSALDPISTSVIEDLIRDLRRRLTVVVVTHNLGQARRLADRVALFWVKEGVGRLVEHEETERLFEAPRERITADYIAGRRG